MKPVAAFANGAWLAASLPAWNRFRRALSRPAETQWRLLRNLLLDNALCAYGQAHGFAGIRTHEEFHERVPVVGYEALEPWIARIMRGESAVLTRELVTRLLPTSGTSGGRKFIPFTAALQREFNRAIGPWLVDLNRTNPAAALGAAYWSISPAMPSPADQASTVPVGFDDDSAYLGGIRQRLVELTFAVSPALRLVSDLERFRYLTLLSLLRQPSWSFASVWHPSFLTLLFDALPGWWEELLGDVAAGGCRRAGAERPEVRRAVAAPPQPRRARTLEQAGPDDPHAIWPRLRSVSCWGDGQAALALAGLRTRLPQASMQPKGLLATEAFVTIPFQGLHPLAVASHFFEFADEADNVLLAHELQPGRRYTVIVTTGGGLWRYRLGDIVEVDGFLEATPSLRFIGRGGGVSDLCGEKLAEAFVTQAVRQTCDTFGLAPAFALLAPETDGAERPHYTLFVEGAVPAHLAARLDESLRQNPHYALCRDLRQLGPLVCCGVARGADEIFCRVQAAAGRRLGDIKPQSLSSRTDWRDQFNGLIRSP